MVQPVSYLGHKVLQAPRVKESYFAICRRDEGGHCLPSGQVGTTKPEEILTTPTGVQKPVPDYVGKPIQTSRHVPEEVETSSKDVIKNLSPSEKEAVTAYTGIDYEAVNKAMRACPPNFECVQGKERKSMLNIEKALELAKPLKQPVTVYRGIDVSLELAETILAEAETAREYDDIFQMSSIISTSLEADTAAAFTTKKSSIVFHIQARRGLYVESITRSKGEKEFIQSAKTRYRVVGTAYAQDVSSYERNVIYLEEVA